MKKTREIAEESAKICGQAFADQIRSNVSCAIDAVNEFQSVEECYWGFRKNALEDSPIKRSVDNFEAADVLFDAYWVLFGGPSVEKVDLSFLKSDRVA